MLGCGSSEDSTERRHRPADRHRPDRPARQDPGLLRRRATATGRTRRSTPSATPSTPCPVRPASSSPPTRMELVDNLDDAGRRPVRAARQDDQLDDRHRPTPTADDRPTPMPTTTDDRRPRRRARRPRARRRPTTTHHADPTGPPGNPATRTATVPAAASSPAAARRQKSGHDQEAEAGRRTARRRTTGRSGADERFHDRQPIRARRPPRQRRHVDRLPGASTACSSAPSPSRSSPSTSPTTRSSSPASAARRSPSRSSSTRTSSRSTTPASTPGRHFIVMEYVEGRSGAQLLQRDGALRAAARPSRSPPRPAPGSSTPTGMGIIHRDVKPGNLMVIGGPAGGPPRDDRQARRLRDRPRRRADPADPGRLGRRHRRLPLARAVARRGGDADLRRLLARRRHLPAAHRPPALRGQQPRRAGDPPRERAAAAADQLREGHPRGALEGRPAGARERARGPLRRRPRLRRGAARRARRDRARRRRRRPGSSTSGAPPRPGSPRASRGRRPSPARAARPRRTSPPPPAPGRAGREAAAEAIAVRELHARPSSRSSSSRSSPG